MKIQDIRVKHGLPRATRSLQPGPAIEGVKRGIFGKKIQIFPNLLSLNTRESRPIKETYNG